MIELWKSATELNDDDNVNDRNVFSKKEKKKPLNVHIYQVFEPTWKQLKVIIGLLAFLK